MYYQGKPNLRDLAFLFVIELLNSRLVIEYYTPKFVEFPFIPIVGYYNKIKENYKFNLNYRGRKKR